MVVEYRADVALPAQAHLGECPRWSAAAERLFWVDIDQGLVHGTTPAETTDQVWAVGEKVGALAPRQRGGLVLAVASGFATLDFATGAVTPIVVLDKPSDVIMNDGACDPAGRFWAGSAALDERPGAGTLFRLSPDLVISEMLTDVTLSNGIGWSPDTRNMYYIDSATGRVDVFDFDLDTGAIGRRRTFVEIRSHIGLPDGLAVDHDGAVWVALWGGGQVRRYLPDAQHDKTVLVPATNVTACAFGGIDGSTLYITTASGYSSESQQAREVHAGSLFAVDVGSSGPPATEFAG